MRSIPLGWLLAVALVLAGCEDGIAIDDDSTGDDDTAGDDDTGSDDDTGDDDDTAGDDDTTAAPPDTIAFEEQLGGQGGQAFTLGGELYVVFGGQILRWDSGPNWDLVVDTSPTGLNCHASYTIEVMGGKAYILGGHYQQDDNCTSGQSGASNITWIFDPSVPEVTPGPPLLHAREVAASGVAGGAIYVLGGWNPNDNPLGANHEAVERFDGTSWEEVEYSGQYVSMRSPAYASSGDSIFLFGGCEPGHETALECPCNSQRVQRFDTTTHTFSQLDSMPLHGRHFSVQHAASRGQYVYVYGGATGFSCVIFDDVARFDTTDETWEVLGTAMTKERKGIGSVIHDDQLFVYGGITCPDEGCDDDACDHPGTIPNCGFTGAGTNEIGTFVEE